MPAQDRPLHYHAGRTGAPVLTGQVDTLENLFYRCLVDGFNTQQATTLTRSGATATFTKSAHGFTDYDWIVVAGADQAEYNGIFQILPGATSSIFQYTITGSPDYPATGTTITAKFLPMGWTRELSSGNKAIFKANAFTSSGVEFRLDDNGSGTQSYRTAFIRGCYGHTDIDTLTYPIFPTVAQYATSLVIHKSSTLDSVARDWDIYGNGRFFYFFASYHASYAGIYNTIFFGDIISAVPAAAYPGCIQAMTSETMAGANLFHNLVSLGSTSTGKYMATAYNQIGDPVAIGSIGNTSATGSQYMGLGGMPSPNPASNGYSMCHVFLGDGSIIIGRMPGIFHLWHDKPYSHRSLMPEFPSLAGRRIMLMAVGAPSYANTGRIPIDLTGPLYD